MTGSDVGDAPMLPDVLGQITPDQEVGSVTADGAYDTGKCHEAIAARNAHAVRQGIDPPDHFLLFLTPAAQECKALETGYVGSGRAKRSDTSLALFGPSFMARPKQTLRNLSVISGKSIIIISDSGTFRRDFKKLDRRTRS